MIPVISIVASRSNVGKTTVLCHIIRELKSRGYRVGTIKHDVHGFDIDHPGKDTWMHAQAGADLVAISSARKMAVIERVEKEYSLDEMLARIENVDIIFTEGYKSGNKPKIEVLRREISTDLFSKPNHLFALVTDTPLDIKTPQFSFYEIKDLVDLIQTKFLRA